MIDVMKLRGSIKYQMRRNLADYQRDFCKSYVPVCE